MLNIFKKINKIFVNLYQKFLKKLFPLLQKRALA